MTGHGVLRSLADGTAQAVLGGLWVPAMYAAGVAASSPSPSSTPGTPRPSSPGSPSPTSRCRPERQAVLAPGAGTPPTCTPLGSSARPVSTSPTSASSATSAARPCQISSRAAWEMPSSSTSSTRYFSSTEDLVRIAYRHADARRSNPGQRLLPLPHLIGETDSAPWKFTRAIQRALNWMNDHDGNDCTDLLERYWPQLPLDVLINSVDDLKDQHVSIRIDPAGFDSWMTILAGRWLIDQPLSYRDTSAPAPPEAAIQTVRLNHFQVDQPMPVAVWSVRPARGPPLRLHRTGAGSRATFPR